MSLVLTAALMPANSQAQLKITEVESSEAGSGKADWFELSNFGSTSVDITGYKIDDNSHTFGLSVPLTGVTILTAGESAVFFEVSGGTPLTVSGFRTWWGLGSSVQVGTYSGSGVGLSAAADEVNIYDSTGTLINGVGFNTATPGVTFGWNPTTQTFGALSSNGVFGAYVAPVDGDIGSPGVVPEPASFAMLGLGAAMWIARRRLASR